MPPLALRLFPFLGWRHRVTPATLRADLVAALLGSLIVLPQAVAFATLAGLPPQYGLYGAMLPTVIGALWGSSWHLVSGPTNATSLMVSASLGALALPFSPEYLRLALTLGLMIGLIKLALGLARLGALVNFISTTVIIGFTASGDVIANDPAATSDATVRRVYGREAFERAWIGGSGGVVYLIGSTFVP